LIPTAKGKWKEKRKVGRWKKRIRTSKRVFTSKGENTVEKSS